MAGKLVQPSSIAFPHGEIAAVNTIKVHATVETRVVASDIPLKDQLQKELDGLTIGFTVLSAKEIKEA